MSLSVCVCLQHSQSLGLYKSWTVDTNGYLSSCTFVRHQKTKTLNKHRCGRYVTRSTVSSSSDKKTLKKEKKTNTHKRTHTHNLLSIHPLLIFFVILRKKETWRSSRRRRRGSGHDNLHGDCKGGEGKKPPETSMGASNRSNTGYTHQDEQRKQPKSSRKTCFTATKKSKRSSQCFAPPHFACSSSSSSSLLPESRYLLASCVPYRAVHHAAAAQFIFAFPTKKQLCVSVRRSRVQIPLVPLAFLDDNFRRWFSYGIFQNWRVFFFGSMSLCCKMLVILPFLCFLSKLFFSKSKSL